MNDLKCFVKNIFEIPLVNSSHPNINKRVCFSNEDFNSNITQIAFTELKKGEEILPHLHETMEEIFLILKGSCEFIVDDCLIVAKKNSLIRIPAGKQHSINAISSCSIFYFGVSI